MRFHLQCHRTISSTTLRADWSISSWTNERPRRARACCSASSWTISSPYRYTPMAWNTCTGLGLELVYFFLLCSSKVFSTEFSLSFTQNKCSKVMCIYLVMNQKVFHVSISLWIRMFDHQLTPAMLDLESKETQIFIELERKFLYVWIAHTYNLLTLVINSLKSSHFRRHFIFMLLVRALKH